MNEPQRFAFDGVLCPVLTPFGATLSPDAQRFIELCRWQLAQGAAGLAVFGTTSEANSLTAAERVALLDALIDGDVPAAKLMPGTGSCALPDAVALTKHAVEHGCGGVLVLPPFYYKGVAVDGLHEFYAELIERVGDARLKLYLYHIPQMSGVAIEFELIEKLRKDYPDTVVGIKDSSGDWDNTVELLRRFPEIAVYPSSEARLVDALKLGGAGCISASANVNVTAIAELAAAWRRDPNAAEIEPLQDKISALRGVVERYPLVPALKLILAHYRDDPAWLMLRPPLSPLEQRQGAELIKALRELDFALD